MQQRSLKDFLKASENGGYLLLYSPTTCSTIGVAELGVWCGMVWCARRRGRRRCSPSAVPWAAYKRGHSVAGLEHGRTRQAFVSRHVHMDGGNGSIHGGETDISFLTSGA